MTRWATGDATGVSFPADPETLEHAGADFLTSAMHAFGTLSPDNSVRRITRIEAVGGGSTGRKALLDVEYEHPCALPDALFVKFSRDFGDPRRDRGASQMELEVAFGAMSAATALPITVPVCLFADYRGASCTGMLLTDRVGYGTDGVEPHYDKCRDYAMPDPVTHYRTLLASVARLAGAHRAGRLPASVDQQFRYDESKVTVGKRIRYTSAELSARVEGLVEFCVAHSDLFPAHVRTPDFGRRIRAEAAQIADREDAIMGWLHATGDHIALCHWNANVDNAWFWRRPEGGVDCGLMDWGCVSVMNVAMALWGSLCSAETAMWDDHLDDLLALFADEYAASGGPRMNLHLLRDQLLLYAAVMGVAWLLEVPGYLRAAVPALADVPDRFDPRVSESEPVRAQLLMLTNVLNLWATRDVGALLTRIG